MTKLWIIDDARTIRCTDALKRNGGRWDAALRVWTFTSEQSAANALATVYRFTRATVAQRECITQMIADGTAAIAWTSIAYAESEAWLRDLNAEEASRLIDCGIRARRDSGPRERLERPSDLDTAFFDTSAFERIMSARRARVRQAAVRRRLSI